ncbi:MAG: DUF2203 domain-containing protein [Tepidisphaeraceae bacterium]
MTLVRRRKRFTLAMANRTLPLVRRIVADVVRTHGRACDLHKRLEVRQSRSVRDEIERQLNDVVELLQDYVDELNEIGCDLKDYRAGLVDFVSTYEGRDIYLCWKLGEETIQYWHELEEGFSGRRPVELLDE